VKPAPRGKRGRDGGVTDDTRDTAGTAGTAGPNGSAGGAGEDAIASLDARIAALDETLVATLAARAEAALARATLERERGVETSPWAAGRDARLLDALGRAGPLGATAVRQIFRETLSAIRALAAPLRVAYLGPEGTYSQAATERHFGHAAETVPEKGIPDIFRAVEKGRAAFGVVPVENSTEGAVAHTLDLLMDTPLRICGEVRLRIEHRLLAKTMELTAVRAVHAHPQALAQCRGWLDANLPDVPRVSESSNAAAARRALDEAGIAAIAGQSAADRYALETLEVGIEDVKTNTTRFFVMGDRDMPPSGNDATSLLLSVPHRPGGLRQTLEPFETAGVSMTRIESRPAPSGLWEYVFFVDVVGHRDDPTIAGVLERLVDELPLLRVLGSYPRAG